MKRAFRPRARHVEPRYQTLQEGRRRFLRDLGLTLAGGTLALSLPRCGDSDSLGGKPDSPMAPLDAGGEGAPPDGPVADGIEVGDGTASSDSLTGRAAFIGNRSEVACDGALTVCKGQTAGCVLDDQHYLQGTFPGERKLIVETKASGKQIRVLLFLDHKQSPGTELEVSWYEPGCADQYKYNLSKDPQAGDLFQKTGSKSIVQVEQVTTTAGDHLMTV